MRLTMSLCAVLVCWLMLPSLGRDGCQPIADSIARGLRGGQGVEDHEPLYNIIADHLCEPNDDCYTVAW